MRFRPPFPAFGLSVSLLMVATVATVGYLTARAAAGEVPVHIEVTPYAVNAGDTPDVTITLDDWSPGGNISISYELPEGVHINDVLSPPIYYSVPATAATQGFTLTTNSSFSGTAIITVIATYEGDEDADALKIN